jgi:hypothetical protein
MPKPNEFKVTSDSLKQAVEYFRKNDNKELTKPYLAQKLSVSPSALDNYLRTQEKKTFQEFVNQNFPNRKYRAVEVSVDDLTKAIAKSINDLIQEKNEKQVFKLTWSSIPMELDRFDVSWTKDLLRKKYKSALVRDFEIVKRLQEDWPECFNCLNKQSFGQKSWSFLIEKIPALLDNKGNQPLKHTNEKVNEFNERKLENKETTQQYGDESNLVFLYGVTLGYLLASKGDFSKLPSSMKAVKSSSRGVDFVMSNNERMEAKQTLSTPYAKGSDYTAANHILCWESGLSDKDLQRFMKERSIDNVFELLDIWKEQGLEHLAELFSIKTS